MTDLRARTRRTASATRSGVNPNSLNSRSAGAEAPKWLSEHGFAGVGGPAIASRIGRRPRRETRARTAGGSTSSR